MAFDLDDCLELLLDARGEEFPHERLIRLFQFQIWIWYPGAKGHAATHAGRLAAAAILRKLEKEHRWRGLREAGGSRHITLAKLHALSQSDEYRCIFTEFIASGGGWSRLLFTTPWAPEFDKRVKQRIDDHAQFIADLIDYRLRAALTQSEGSSRSGPTHAIFFKWWPNRNRFVTRTAFNWWKPFRRTAVFIYLIERRGFHMRPSCTDDDAFSEHLMHPAISKAQLQRFFAEYQFAANVLGDESLYALPQVMRPAEFQMKPFSPEELSIIAAYDEHSKEMNDPKKGLGVGPADENAIA
jgi:hypothetical protein